MSEASTPTVKTDPNEPIIAKGGTYYRTMRYIMAAFICGWAGWFAYDGWKAWPAQNERYAQITADIQQAEARGDASAAALLKEQQKDVKQRSQSDIRLQRILATTLPLLALAVVAWAHYNSRGQFRLVGNEFSAPGHPPITLEDITALDKRLWDRKDIAYVEYEKGAAKGRIRLDAFVYQTDPIVKIYNRIEAVMKEESETPDTPPAA